jgi:Protein of unknown function (DUF2971)
MNDAMEGFYNPTEGLRGTEEFRRVVRRIYDAKNNSGIACFSETNTNELMWAHYADNYAGICIGYDTRSLAGGLSDQARVVRLVYGDTPPPIGEGDALNTTSAARKILSHKKANWAYEREWRVLGRNGINEYEDDRAVTAVYFGSRINSNNRDELLEGLQGLHIDFFDMAIEGYQHVFRSIGRPKPARGRRRVTRG